MCGITGVFDTRGRRDVDRSTLVRMNESQHHRGPDEVGLHAAQDRLHVHDLHATILYLLGLDNMGLVYRYKGRPERPTLNEGEAYRRIVG